VTEQVSEPGRAGDDLHEVHLFEVPVALWAKAQFAGVSTEQEQRLYAAAEAGTPVIDDLAYAVPGAAAQASQTLGDMLDEADDFAREGTHLLTLAADPDVVTFRWWYLRQFIDQVAGDEPVPWPAYEAEHHRVVPAPGS